MKKLLVLLLLIYPLSAAAVTYQWTDEAGTVNFTEDLGNVPKKYRKRVKVLGADESGGAQVIESAPLDKGEPKDLAGQKAKKAADKKGEAELRRDYAQAMEDVKATRQEIAELRARLADTSKMSRGEYLSLQNTLKQSEFHLQGELEKVEQARRKAEKAGVAVEK